MVWMCKLGVRSQERLKIEVKLLLSTNRKSYMPRRLAQQRMTLSDLGWPFHASRAISAVAARAFCCYYGHCYCCYAIVVIAAAAVTCPVIVLLQFLRMLRSSGGGCQSVLKFPCSSSSVGEFLTHYFDRCRQIRD